jgi:hypothetical protein
VTAQASARQSRGGLGKIIMHNPSTGPARKEGYGRREAPTVALWELAAGSWFHKIPWSGYGSGQKPVGSPRRTFGNEASRSARKPDILPGV